MRTFSTVPSDMRASSRTSASLRGLPAGSRILAEYIPVGEPGSRLTSTLGTPANRGDVNLVVGSDLGGAVGSDLGADAGSDLDGAVGSDLDGAEAACLGAGSFTLDLARRLPVVPGAACGAGGALLSADGSRSSRGDADGSRLPRADAALASTRDDKDDGSPPAEGSVARGGASGTACGAALCLSE